MATPSVDYGFAFNGWLFGGVGQATQILSIQGLDDIPSLRVQDDNRGFADGAFTGRDFLNGRSIIMQLQIMPTNTASMYSNLADMKANLVSQQSGTGTLQFIIPNRGVQRVNARVRRRAINIDPVYSYGKAFATIEFFCPDPRIYSDTLKSYNFQPSNGVGRTYPRIYPLLYNATTNTDPNKQTLTNAGNYETFPTATIVGPVTNPSVVNFNNGKQITFITTLTASDTLVVDFDMKTVLLNGTTSRNLMTGSSKWFSMGAGTTTLGFTASTSSSGSQMTLTYRDAYL